jgi:hypothetical protein
VTEYSPCWKIIHAVYHIKSSLSLARVVTLSCHACSLPCHILGSRTLSTNARLKPQTAWNVHASGYMYSTTFLQLVWHLGQKVYLICVHFCILVLDVAFPSDAERVGVCEFHDRTDGSESEESDA